MADRSERRVALVTGGGTGLGRAISLCLAEAGMDVAVNYSRSAAEAAETVEAACALGARAEAYRADVAREDQVAAMIEGVVGAFGRLDVLVSNAGATTFCPFEDLEAVSEADWDAILGVNVKGTWFCARHAAPHLRARGAGHLITISSTAGLITFGSSIPYCVSKAALIHLTRCLARALAPEVQVNSVAPGYLDTRWGRRFGEEGMRGFVARSALRRVPTVEDVARQVLTLVTGTSSTGQVYVVDAGLTLAL
ncbi:MAG TPA: SDR family oxidoreductase [Candidatus Dormibacteraeota bacterium]|nr:SDR family oxidoreductase [Candidatus Dormibacteraeota bacterium]